MEGLPEGRPRERKRWWTFGRVRLQPCFRVEHRTLSDTTAAPERSSGSKAANLAVVVAAEARDVLSPLPSLRLRTSTASGRLSGSPSGRRTSTYSGDRLSDSPSIRRTSTASGGRLSESPSAGRRTMGSLTAWQMLAADVQRDMEAAAAGGGGSRRSSGASDGQLSRRSSRACTSLLEPDAMQLEEGPANGSSVCDQQEQQQEQQEQQSSDILPLPQDSLPQPQQDVDGNSGGSSGALSAASDSTLGGGEPSEGRLQREYEVLGELGHGAFGRALKARRRRDGALVCLKALDSRSMGATERRMTQDEVRVLSQLQHPNIVQYQDCFSDNGWQYIAMEFCEEGDLEGLIRGRGGAQLPESEVMLKFVQLCLALQHVHSKGILHRDVKPQNLFLTHHGILKLGDFGISKIMSPGRSYARTMVGTPFYFSPELVEDKQYDRKSDVWSAGCVLYELCALQRPFRGSSVSAIAVKILRGAPAPLPEQYSPELRELVRVMLQRKPERRPSIDEVLRMPLVRHHLHRYRDYVQRTVEHRKASYCQALEPFHLDPAGPDVVAAAAAAAADQPLHQLSHSRGQAGASRLSAAAVTMAAAQDAHTGSAAKAAAVAVAGTVVVRADLMQAPSADLASALAAAEALAEGDTSDLESAAVAAAALTVVSKGLPRQSSSPGSPRSMVLPSLSSMATSHGSGEVGPGAAWEPPCAGAAVDGGTCISSAASSCSAGSVGSLRRRAPHLMQQVNEILQQSTLVASPSEAAREEQEGQDPGPGRRRDDRREAEQACVEELHTGRLAPEHVQALGAALPPPAFS